MKVVLAGFGMESLTKTAADLKALGAETLIVQTDVSQVEQVEDLAAATVEAFGQVDLLVNNAGAAGPGKTLELTLDDWNWIMGVNFYGVLYGLRAFVPRMIKREQPSHAVIVLILKHLFDWSYSRCTTCGCAVPLPVRRCLRRAMDIHYQSSEAAEA